MDTLSAARSRMELSLAFPMVLAASGIGMPLLMLMAAAAFSTHSPKGAFLGDLSEARGVIRRAG
jgi:hypothetical protein